MEKKPPASPPFSGNFWPTLLLILAVLGIPGTAVSAFLTQHIRLCIGIGLLYEVALIVLGFLADVWGILKPKWAKQTADSLDYRVQSIFSGYKKKYYDYLRYQHRDFDVLGLNLRGAYKLELDQIFVDLSVDARIIDKAAVSLIPQTLLEGGHAIWDFLASAHLREQNFAIVGPPGSGKTTLLKHIARTMVSHQRVHIQSEQGRVPYKLPIFLFLRDHARAIDKAFREETTFSLVNAIHDHLKKGEQPEPPAGWFQQQLEQGRCLVMLDGLDEVAELDMRKNVVGWVERQMKVYPRSRFIVTSRPSGIRSNPLNVTTLEVQRFTPAQVEQFIHKWYLANEIMSKQKDDSGVRMVAKAEAKGLLQQLRSKPNLFDLTVNPLLLTMITTIHCNGGGGRLPEQRVTLYGEICSVFLGGRQEKRGVKLPLTREQMQLVLESLAYHMMTNNKRDIKLDEVKPVIQNPLSLVNAQITPERFLQLVENASGLLFERESGVYSFAHQTFQEYLAAAHISKQHLEAQLQTRVEDLWWKETILFYCAMADATPIITACLAGTYPSVAALELAIDCDKEALGIEDSQRIRLNTMIEQGRADPDPERQHVVAGALLARRLRDMIHLKDETYIDTSLITCAEYQLFLDEQRGQEKFFQPDHWTSYHFPSDQSNDPVLGVRRSDAEAFCDWLTVREPTWSYRLPERGELEHEGNHEKLPAGKGYWLNSKQGFAWVGQASMLPGDIIQEIRYNFARDLDRARKLDITLDLALALDIAHNLAHNFDIAHNLAHNLACDLSRNSTRDLDLTRRLAHNVARNLADAHARNFDLTRHSVLPDIFSFFYTGSPSPQRRFRRFLLSSRTDRQEAEKIQIYIDAVIKIYIDLTILEKRIKGELPACEGILIVKEKLAPSQ